MTVSPFTQSPPDTEAKLKSCFHTHVSLRPLPGRSEFAHAPRSRAPSSTGPGRALGCRAGGSRAARRRSTCCSRSGWCRRGAAAGSAPCAAGSRRRRRFWCNAPTRRPPSCRGGRGRQWHCPRWYPGAPRAPRSCTVSLGFFLLSGWDASQGATSEIWMHQSYNFPTKIDLTLLFFRPWYSASPVTLTQPSLFQKDHLQRALETHLKVFPLDLGMMVVFKTSPHW